MSYWKKNGLLLTEIAIISLFVILVGLQASKRFTLDEMDFPTVSKTASQTMRPVWYKGELTDRQSGLFHPPLYIHSLSIFIRVFGFSETTVRIFGLICALITSYILINLLKLFNFKNRWGEALFLAIFLLNPYTIACATVPDIDTTIMPIFMLAFIYVSLRMYWKKNIPTKYKYELLILGVLFALSLWTKLTTPLTLPFFLLGLLLICKYSIKESLLKTVKVTLLGALIFLVSYFLYTKVVNLPMSYTFTFLAQSFFKGTSGHQPLLEKITTNASYINSQVYWFTIPLTVVYLISLVSLTFKRKFDIESNIIRLLSYFSLGVFVFYICLIAPFGGFFKYPFPVHGLMILTVVLYFQTTLAKARINILVAVVTLFASCFVSTRYIRDDVFLKHSTFNGFLYLLIIVGLSYALLQYKKSAKWAGVAFIYALFVVTGYQLGISRIQAISPYPTKYLYGQRGMDETISYLKLHTSKDEVIWSMKDVGFYVNDKYYESYQFYFDKSIEPDLQRILKEGKIRYYVATTGIGEDRIDAYKNIADILDQKATKVATFNNFVIYRSNASLTYPQEKNINVDQ